MTDDLRAECEPILRRVVAEVRRSTGFDLQASIRWVTREEQREWHASFDRMADDPNVRHVLLGSTDAKRFERPLDGYEGYWALDLVDQVTMIHDVDDIVDVIEEYVIEAVWETTGHAPRPGFLQGL